MSEPQCLVWLFSMPACAQINLSMQTLTGLRYETSDQHKDVSKSRKQHDIKDTLKLLAAFKQWNPFIEDESLHGIVNGVIAGERVNVDKSNQVGQKILESMVGQNMQEYSFKKKCQVVTLDSKSAVDIKGEQVNIDPQLLFQRLSVIASNGENLADTFKYELCSFPPAMFESSVLPRQANKAALADALWEEVKNGQPKSVQEGQLHTVVDGGALLHWLPRQRGSTFEQLM